MRRWKFAVTALLTAMFSVTVGNVTNGSAAGTSLKIIFPDGSVSMQRSHAGKYHADVSFLLQNGALAASGVTLRAYASLGSTTSELAVVQPLKATDHLPANSVQRLNTDITFPSPDYDKLTIVVQASQPVGSAPVSTTLKLTHGLPASGYVWSLTIALIWTTVTFLVHSIVFYCKKTKKATGKRRLQLRLFTGTVYPPAANWSFSSNWATSVSAIGAVLGTVLTSTGWLTDVFPGLDTDRLLGTSLLLTSMLLVTPLIVLAGQRRGKAVDDTEDAGIISGALVAAAFIVVLVAIVNLCGVGLLLSQTNFGKPVSVGIYIILGLGATALAWYTYRTLFALRSLKPAAEPPKLAPTKVRGLI